MMGNGQGMEPWHAAENRGGGCDMVVSDLGVPHLADRQVPSTIKMLSFTTPIILFTDWGQPFMPANDFLPHVDHLLSKPPRLQELRVVLSGLAT